MSCHLFQINLLFLINIVRVVLLKSQGPSDLSAHSEGAHIKKALRATIILFPLLGNENRKLKRSNQPRLKF